MTLQLQPDDSRLSWEGAVSLEHTDEGVRPWRIPHEDRILFHEALRERAATPAGVRVAFRSDATSVAGSFLQEDGAHPIDLCCDHQLVESHPFDGTGRFSFSGLDAAEKVIELWLPQRSSFVLKALELNDGASLAPFDGDRPKWITYGSSITHCGSAESPVYTWPAIVARGHDLNLTCLGYGGSCHLEPMVARMIRDLPADFLSMCVGINIYGSTSIGPRAFRSAIIGFVKIVREKRPDVPYVVMSPIISPPREEAQNAVGFTLPMMRDEVAAAVEALRERGDRNLHYVDGLDIFGSDFVDLLPDQLHPNAEGYKVMGRNFLEKVAKVYFKK